MELHPYQKYDHTWEGTLYDLLALVAEQGGDMGTHLSIASDGEPLYFEAFVEDK